jgi:hypothetical protein
MVYLIMKIFRSIILICLALGIFLFYQCNSTLSNPTTQKPKHKGAHLFGFMDTTNLKPLVDNNYNWITLVSFGDQKDFDSPAMVYYRGDSLEMARRDSAWASQINIAHDAGFKVFFKPHLWISEPRQNKWRSDIFPSNENNWELWKESYREFILYYATIAEKNKVEMFCIGVEFSRLAVEKTDFWRSLIKEVRTVFTGKLTYAANWYEEYEKIEFWDELDFIGVQAYFPLVKIENPSVEQVAEGWNNYLPALSRVSKKFKKKILFTEMGYKSTTDSAIEPWLWLEKLKAENITHSNETQANCYQAFFNMVWGNEWFAGVHVWQLRSMRLDRKSNPLSPNFSPQGKPAEEVIARGFEDDRVIE